MLREQIPNNHATPTDLGRAWLTGYWGWPADHFKTDVGGEKLRQSFNDLSSITNFGFQLSAAARYKRFILSFDGTYAALGSELGSELQKVKLMNHSSGGI